MKNKLGYCYYCKEPLTSDDFKLAKVEALDVNRTFSDSPILHKDCMRKYQNENN